MNTRQLAEHIFLSGIRGVLPQKVIGDLVSLRGDQLKIGFQTIDLSKAGKLFVLGAGKASAAMAHYIEVILGNRISGGHVVTRYGHYCQLSYISITEAGHPVPDSNSFEATKKIIQIAQQAAEEDIVICLFSGGGSALLADYPSDCKPEDISGLNDILVKSGADIREINTVRKHLSNVKGGNLMKHIWPATCYTILISDVTNDPLDIIASGPTVPDDSTFIDAYKILERRQLTDKVAPSVLEYLRHGIEGHHPENPKSGNSIFSKSNIYLAGNIRMALLSAADEASRMDLTPVVVTSELYGDPAGACEYIINTALLYKIDNNFKKPACLLFGGETAIKVSGEGIGGRNQQLALEAAVRLKYIPGITILSAGTDGTDGNSDVAGAVADCNTTISKKALSLDPQYYLRNFDTYNYFRVAGGLIRTGPTFTNVMDMIVAIIE